MATRTTAPKRTQPAIDVEAAADAIARAVRRDGALRKAQLLKEQGVGRAQAEAVTAALTARGLEVGASVVRVPLREQIAQRLGDARVVPLRGIEAAVAGGTRRDVLAASRELVARGGARVGVRSSEVVLLDLRTDALDERDLARLEELAATLTKTLRTARRAGGTLVRADAEEALRAALPPRRSPPAPGDLDVEGAIDRLRDATGLTFVPAVVRALGGAAAVSAVHDAVLRAARSGRLELRPESGMGRLGAEDASFCIPGPRGSILSWVRRLEEMT